MCVANWFTYVGKGGPNSKGAGLPFGDKGIEHSWQAPGGPHGQRQEYTQVTQVNNFENGAVLWNEYEGGMRSDYNQHATFLPNCRAYDIGDPTYIDRLEGMVGRFAISNDFDLNVAKYESFTGAWADNGVHPWVNETEKRFGLATRAELAQSLVMA
jgi:hypothetical protein